MDPIAGCGPACPVVWEGRQAQSCRLDPIIQAIHDFEVSAFDVVLIDGRARIDCAIEAAPLLPKGGFLLFHDFWLRKRYVEALPRVNHHFRLVKAVHGTPQTLALFEKR